MEFITPRDYRTRGEGVAFNNGKLPKKILARIEMVGELNDRRKKYVGMRSRVGLFKLAKEYERKGMVMMAADIRAEARLL